MILISINGFSGVKPTPESRTHFVVFLILWYHSTEAPQTAEVPDKVPTIAPPVCPVTPVPTPTRTNKVTPSQKHPSLDSIPEIGDTRAPQPKPKELRMSPAAADARLRRCMEPSRRTGKFKVSDEVLLQYKKNGKSRQKLRKIFETCGYDQDKGFSG